MAEDDGSAGLRAQKKFPFATLQDALETLARTNAQAVLVDLTHGPARNSEDLAQLLEAARCPVLVFGASDANSMLEHQTQIPPAPTTGGHEGDY